LVNAVCIDLVEYLNRARAARPIAVALGLFAVIESFDGIRPNKEEDGVILLDRGWFSKAALVVILV
jgi:hypothetical protein